MFLQKVDNFLNKSLSKFYTSTVLLMRFGLGIAFILHGKSKFPLPPQKLMDFFGFSPFLASFVALSEIFSGLGLILSVFLKNYVGNLIARVSALVIVVIMIFAFYFAHKDWFINENLFTSEQFFLLIIGIYFLVNGNKHIKGNSQ